VGEPTWAVDEHRRLWDRLSDAADKLRELLARMRTLEQMEERVRRLEQLEVRPLQRLVAQVDEIDHFVQKMDHEGTTISKTHIEQIQDGLRALNKKVDALIEERVTEAKAARNRTAATLLQIVFSVASPIITGLIVWAVTH
jgi:hypothetical protein